MTRRIECELPKPPERPMQRADRLNRQGQRMRTIWKAAAATCVFGAGHATFAHQGSQDSYPPNHRVARRIEEPGVQHTTDSTGRIVFHPRINPETSSVPASAPRMPSMPSPLKTDTKSACWATPKDGKRPAVSPNPDGYVYHQPSISAMEIDTLAMRYKSPLASLTFTDACGKKTFGQWVYDYYESQRDTKGIPMDPGLATAQWIIEDGLGAQGVARFTHNLGNVRPTPGQPSLDNFVLYKNWKQGVLQGIPAYARLLANLYVQDWGLDTVRKIIPVYAPSADSNDPLTYESAMLNFMTQNYAESNAVQEAQTKKDAHSILKTKTQKAINLSSQS